MSRTVCKIISLLTAVLLLLGCFAGCGGKEPEKTDTRYRKLFEKGIVIDNNIEIIQLSKESDSCSIEYIRIDGLKNKTVQDKINNRIIEVMEEMEKQDFIPPYRGIIPLLKKYGNLDRRTQIDIFSQFNSNNILSVDSWCYVFYSDDENYFTYSYSVPLNFDLSNGEELTLGDLFAPDTDYIETINKAVDRRLLEGGFDDSASEYGFSMTSPFQTVRPEQKFTIGPEGDIFLCIDYSTPEFYTGSCNDFSLVLTSSGLGDDIQLYRSSDNPLYESDELKLRFMSDTDESYDKPIDKENQQMSSFISYRCVKGAPEKIQKLGRSYASVTKNLPISMADFKKQAKNKLGKSNKLFFSIMIDTYQSDIKSNEYYSFIQDVSYSSRTESQDDAGDDDFDDNYDYYAISYSTCFCFDPSGKKVELRSLFVNPDDAEKLLPDAIKNGIYIPEDMEITWSDKELRALADELVTHINGFSIETDHIDVSYDLSDDQIEDLITRSLDISDTFYISSISCNAAYYSDIGYENLVFFRDAFR